MENASKALIMAGSVLIALMIIGALLLMFNSLSSYQNTNTQTTREAQVVEFNNQYETYLRDNVRGSDMISLMNKIIDYNTRKGDNSEEKYQEMKIDITGIAVSNLKYASSDEAIINSEYNQDTISDLLNTVKELENTYQLKYISALSTNISNVMDSKEKTASLLNKSSIDDQYWKKIKIATAKYYQYSQFKRLYFNCDTSKTEYSNTGRITYIKFTCTNKLG